MAAEVEAFTTYYALCSVCGWQGNEHEDDKPKATKDAEAHKCAGESRAEFQEALDRALDTISERKTA